MKEISDNSLEALTEQIESVRETVENAVCAWSEPGASDALLTSCMALEYITQKLRAEQVHRKEANT